MSPIYHFFFEDEDVDVCRGIIRIHLFRCNIICVGLSAMSVSVTAHATGFPCHLCIYVCVLCTTGAVMISRQRVILARNTRSSLDNQSRP